jgi:hypothetical protein
MIALLSVHPFSKLPLRIQCFTQYAHDLLEASPRHSLPSTVTVTLDLAGVAGTARRTSDGGADASNQKGPIDVQDSEFRLGQWEKWRRMRAEQIDCQVCDKIVNVNVRARFVQYLTPRITSTPLSVRGRHAKACHTYFV